MNLTGYGPKCRAENRSDYFDLGYRFDINGRSPGEFGMGESLDFP